MTYFGPVVDPPLGGSGRKTTTLVRDHEYFIPTKFHQNPSSSSGEEVENVKVYWRRMDDGRTTDGRRTDGRTTDGRTDDRRCAMTIAHLRSAVQFTTSMQPRRAKGHRSTLNFANNLVLTWYRVTWLVFNLQLSYFTHECKMERRRYLYILGSKEQRSMSQLIYFNLLVLTR